MTRFHSDQPDPAVAAILLASRPEPDPEWVEGLERRLLKPRRSRRSRFTFGIALATGLAGVAVVFSLVGIGPLVRASDTVDARDHCRVATIPSVARVPVVVRDADGTVRLISRDRRVLQRVIRCSLPAPPRAAGGSARER